jgi:hypothetical protein
MDIDQHRASKPASGPAGKVMRDFKQLQESGGASVEELRDFLHSMKGKNPQEMLGTVAQSNLVRSTFLSVVICSLLLAGLTGMGLGYKIAFPPAKKPTKTAATAAATAAQAGGKDAPKAASGKTGDPATPTKGLAENLGIGETKDTPPKLDPFKKGGSTADDDLLDGPNDKTNK